MHDFASCGLNWVVPLISLSQMLGQFFVPFSYSHFLPSLNTALFREEDYSKIESVYLYLFDKFEHDDARFFVEDVHAVLLLGYWPSWKCRSIGTQLVTKDYVLLCV